jgi:hypothetical protein
MNGRRPFGDTSIVRRKVDVGHAALKEVRMSRPTKTKKEIEAMIVECVKDRYQTQVESWRHLQSANIEFTMQRLREPIER